MAKLFIITGPSGVGKTTIAQEALGRVPELKKLVTYTTRPPRPGEVDGRDYLFVSEDEFARRRDAGEFMEFANVYGYWYGNSRRDIETQIEAGTSLLVVLDVQGALYYEERQQGNPVTIFIQAEHPAVLRDRLIRRGKITAADLTKRTEEFAREIASADQFDYTVVNREGEMERAVGEVVGIIREEIERSS